MVYFDKLPSEVIWQIAQYLPRKSLSCYTRICSHIHRSAGHLLLAHLHMDPTRLEQAAEALDCIRPQSWQYVKSLEINIDLDRSDDVLSERLDLPTDSWAQFFMQLSRLKQLTVEFNLVHLNSIDVDAIFGHYYWQKLMASLTATSAAAPPDSLPSLDLRLLEGYGISANSSVWTDLLRPFRAYSQVKLTIDAWDTGAAILDNPLPLANAFDPASSVELHLGALCVPSLLLVETMPQVQGLEVLVRDHETCIALWACIARHSGTLKNLELQQPSIAGDLVHLCTPVQTEQVLPQLLHLEGNLSGSCLLEHVVRHVRLPALQSLKLAIEVNLLSHCMAYFTTGVTCGPDCTSADEYSVISLLERLDEMLPKHCRSRTYTLRIMGGLTALQCYMGRLATLAKTIPLNIHISCYLMHADPDAGSQEHELLVEALPLPCRPALASMEIYLSCHLERTAFPASKVRLPKLKQLTIYAGPRTPTSVHKFIKRLLWETLDMPALEALHLDAGYNQWKPYFHILSNVIGAWKTLESICLVTDLPEEDMSYGKAYIRFRRICRVFGVAVNLHHRHLVDAMHEYDEEMSDMVMSDLENWGMSSPMEGTADEGESEEPDFASDGGSEQNSDGHDNAGTCSDTASEGQGASDSETGLTDRSEYEDVASSDYEEGLYYRQVDSTSEDECECEQNAIETTVNFEDKYREEDDNESLGAMWDDEE